MTSKSKPLYMIGVVADMLKVHPQTLRMYEKKGLFRPSRSEGRTRMYSADDVDEISRVIRLARDLGVNLAGIEIILKMRRRMLDMQTQIEDLTSYVQSEPGAAEYVGSGNATRWAASDRRSRIPKCGSPPSRSWSATIRQSAAAARLWYVPLRPS